MAFDIILLILIGYIGILIHSLLSIQRILSKDISNINDFNELQVKINKLSDEQQASFFLFIESQSKANALQVKTNQANQKGNESTIKLIEMLARKMQSYEQ